MTSQLKNQKTAFLFFIFIAGLLAAVAQDKLDEKTLEAFRRSDEFDDVTEVDYFGGIPCCISVHVP